MTRQQAKHELLQVGLVNLLEVDDRGQRVRVSMESIRSNPYRKHRAAVGVAGSFPGKLDVV